MPSLNWAGKDKVINHHLDVPMHVLERVYGFDERGRHEEAAGSGNMIIHGDNLAALKALLPRYEGRVDCIYIDPPYNTGNEGWVYNDNVNDGRISVSGYPPKSLNFPRECFRGTQADGGRVLFLEAAERNFDKARDSATSFSQSALNRA